MHVDHGLEAHRVERFDVGLLDGLLEQRFGVVLLDLVVDVVLKLGIKDMLARLVI